MTGLVKPKKYDIEDSNIALLGSDLEKNVKLNAAKTEPAWEKAGKELGIQIWRIEKFQVVAWPKDLYGEFYSGDSYIVLRTYKKPDDKKFSFDVHFWLGKETTQDEAGTAAYKTVELDDYLAGVPVQHREVQQHESELFLSYFKQYKIQEGGVDTGFKHVKPEEYRPRLLRIKGIKNRVAVTEVERSYKSLNSGDVFILDGGLKIYQFNGISSSGMERSKAMNFANALQAERQTAKVTVYSEGDSDLAPFWEAIGGEGPIMSAEEGGSDAEASRKGATQKRLLRLSDESGKVEFTEVPEASQGIVRQSMFDSNDVFVFDSLYEVFVWVGKSATAQEKRLGLQYAQQYLTKYNRPAWLPISRVLEKGENEVFISSLDPPEQKGYIPKKKSASKDALSDNKPAVQQK